MSELKPTGAVLGACTATGAGACILPVTGVNMATELALVFAAVLAVWALAYAGNAKFGKR